MAQNYQLYFTMYINTNKTKNILTNLQNKRFSTQALLNNINESPNLTMDAWCFNVCFNIILAGEKLYSCGVCGFQAAEPSAIITHKKIQHAPDGETKHYQMKGLSCELCGRQYSEERQLKVTNVKNYCTWTE